MDSGRRARRRLGGYAVVKVSCGCLDLEDLEVVKVGRGCSDLEKY